MVQPTNLTPTPQRIWKWASYCSVPLGRDAKHHTLSVPQNTWRVLTFLLRFHLKTGVALPDISRRDVSARQEVGCSCLWVLASPLKAAACFWLATGGIPRTFGPLDSYYVFILLRRQASSSPLSAWLIMSDCGHLVTQLQVHLYFL